MIDLEFCMSFFFFVRGGRGDGAARVDSSVGVLLLLLGRFQNLENRATMKVIS